MHRLAIGTFYYRLRYVCQYLKGTRKMLRDRHLQSSFPSRSLVFFIFIMYFACLNLHYGLVRASNLTRNGIEINPGPGSFVIRKSVQASHHQGDICRYGIDSAGKQCTAIAHFAIVFSAVKNINIWKSFDLDYILEQGDKIFKQVCRLKGNYDYLAVDEPPLSIQLEGISLSVRRLALENHLFGDRNNLFENHIHYSETEKGNGAIFTCSGLSIAVIWAGDCVFLFDSHSRNINGRHDPNGQAVLLKFSLLSCVNNYIKSFYEDSLNISPETQYDLQYISVDLTEESKNQIVSVIRRKRKSTANHSHYQQNKKLILERRKEYFIKNNEVVKLKERHYKAERKDKIREHYLDNVDFIREQKQNYYKENIEALKNKNAKYYEENINFFKNKNAKYYKESCKNMKCNKKVKRPDERIKLFSQLCKEGPVFVCVICNRCFYEKSIKKFNKDHYKLDNLDELIYNVNNIDMYICQTCDRHMRKQQIPVQAVWNKLGLFKIPEVLSNLNRLEKVLIARRILFKKVSIMPKGRFPKLKGSICNIPIETAEVTNVLPRGADSNGLIVVKLKRKLSYRGHVYFEAVRPESIHKALQYLKHNNPLYSDIDIALSNIPNDLLSLSSDVNVPESETSSNSLEEDENPLDLYRFNSQETMFIPNIMTSDEISIAPGEGKQPKSVLNDKYCEELAFPHLYPKGKFGFNFKREKKLSPVKYFNQRLLNYTQMFASDPDFIFYALSVMQQLNLQSQINIAMKKVCAGHLTAGMLSHNFSERVKEFIAKDDAYHFMNTIKGTPAYWKKFLYEVLAMVKQLGLPTFFMTLSCADLHWNELVSIIARLNGENLNENDINNMDFFERCHYLNLNPVILARHFQYRVEIFFKVIVINGPLGKVKYHAIRVEFQVRGSPHVHSFLWVIDAPILTADNVKEYRQFVDSIIKSFVPNVNEDQELFHLVTTYQVHSHSKSCRKYKNEKCRYHFGKFFTDRTIISLPLPNDLPDVQRINILNRREHILSAVKHYIDENLDPRKRNILNPLKENFEKLPSIPDILAELNISEEEYYNALSISNGSDFQIHIQRAPNACFVNNFFVEGLKSWKANIDIQPVFNHYKAVTYMCAYFSKAEDETSEAMKQAAKEAFKGNKTDYEKMKAVARAYATKRECSVQEAVYLLMPELWLRRIFPRVIFLNSNIPSKRYRIFKKKDKIDDLPSDSTDIFQQNMLDRYVDRPDEQFQNGNFKVIDEMCYAEFLSLYYVPSKPSNAEDDCQPVILNDDLLELNHRGSNFPKKIPLISSKQKLNCRKVKAVLRYHQPNPHKDIEGYAHHLLFSFYPFRNEECLKSPPFTGTYFAKLQEPGVLDVINRNKSNMEPYCEVVDQALSNLTLEVTNPDAFSRQENDEVQQELANVATDLLLDEPVADDAVIFDDVSIPAYTAPVIMPDIELNSMIRSLNVKQRKLFDIVQSWAKTYVKNMSVQLQLPIEPLHIFLTGNAGCGKSFLMKLLYHSLTKTFACANVEKPKVLLMAPTGVAAINIDGTTIHTALNIPIGNFGKNLPPLNSQMKSRLRNKLSDLKVLMIDEISMVSNDLLYYIHLRLIEIFDKVNGEPFAGLTVITVGDFFQLPPVGGKPVYAEYKNNWQNFEALWKIFKIFELTEVMRQRGDSQLIDLLNNVRTADIQPNDIDILKSRVIEPDTDNYPHDALHIFAENANAKRHNFEMLQSTKGNLFSISSIDNLPKNIPQQKIKEVLNRNQSETGGLAGNLDLKLNARVMLTVNIDLQDRLVNGQLGIVKHILVDSQKQISKIYIKFDDSKAGKTAMRNDNFARQRGWVPIEKASVDIRMKVTRSSSPFIKRTQFPLMLAWACTVHKVQGLSLSKIVVSFQLLKQRNFNFGQIYVALSRVTSLDGLFILGTFDKKAIRASPKALEEYNRMRHESILIVENVDNIESDSLTIALLNIRSFNKHVLDLQCDKRLIESDIICLTETQLRQSLHPARVLALQDFEIVYNNTEDTFQSLAICARSNINITSHIKMIGASIITFFKPTYNESQPIKLLLLYKKCAISITDFCNWLQEVVTYYKVDIILGDFNINGYNENVRLSNMLTSYDQIVTVSTHISGSLLDHVYIHKDFSAKVKMHKVVNVFFSDHDAVKFRIQ